MNLKSMFKQICLYQVITKIYVLREFDYTLAEVPGVARRIKKSTIEKNQIFKNNFKHLSPAIWPAIANIYNIYL